MSRSIGAKPVVPMCLRRSLLASADISPEITRENRNLKKYRSNVSEYYLPYGAGSFVTFVHVFI